MAYVINHPDMGKREGYGTYSEDMRSLIIPDGEILPFEVLESGAGFYIGTWLDGPWSRESENYWKTREEAQKALDTGKWLPLI